MFETHYYLIARLALRRTLRSQGYGLREINHLVSAAEDALIDSVSAASNVTQEAVMGATANAAAAGTHPIIDAIIAFFTSAQGQAIIAALIKILLAALGI